MTCIKKVETPSKKNWMKNLTNAIEAKINSFIRAMEEYLKKGMEYLKKYMEFFKEGGTKMLQERPPNHEKVVEETHDEKKINVNHELIEPNIGLKTHHIPKIDMRKFGGKDPITWILQMEKYFDLHDVHCYKRYVLHIYI